MAKLEMEDLENAVDILKLDGFKFIRTIREARIVELKVTEFAGPGTLYLLDSAKCSAFPGLPVDENLKGHFYLICHTDDRETASRMLREIRGETP